MKNLMKLTAFGAALIITMSCVPNTSPPPPLVKKELPQRPKSLSIGATIFNQFNYDSDTNLISYRWKEETPVIIDYDQNGELKSFGFEFGTWHHEIFKHTADSIEVIKISNSSSDTIQLGYKHIVRFDSSNRVNRYVYYTNGSQFEGGEYEYDSNGNISKFTLIKFRPSVVRTEYIPVYDTILNPFYFERNNYLSNVFLQNSLIICNFTTGSKYFPIQLNGPNGVVYNQEIEYDYGNKRISKVTFTNSTGTAQIVDFTY